MTSSLEARHRGPRPYIHLRLPPLIVSPWPVLTVCDNGQGWHSPTGSRTQQVRSSLDVLIHGHGQPRFTAYYSAPLDAMVGDAQHSIRVDSCQAVLKNHLGR